MAGISNTFSSDLANRNLYRGHGRLHYDGLRSLENNPTASSKNTATICFSNKSQGRIRAMASSTNSVPKRQKDPKKRIVITGMGLVSVFGNDVDTFYHKLLKGESGISLIDKFDALDFPVRIAGQIRHFCSEGYVKSPTDLCFDDCWRYSIVAAKKALGDANLGPEVLKNMNRSNIGVVIGSGSGGVASLCDSVNALLREEYSKILSPYYQSNFGPALLAIETGLMGPNYSISTACATANYCFYAAANHIRKGEAEIMIAGGSEAGVIPTGICGFSACRALSNRNDDPEKASRPWDMDRDGFVLSEGSGVLVMESLEHATKRGANIIAEYLGGAITCDAHHLTEPRSDGLGVIGCITKSLENAGVSPEEVNYVNAHATSTRMGDLAEVNAIKKVFKDTTKMKMNATKSMIGHALGAAGGLEAIATIKAITTGWLHPTINQYNIEPEVTIDTVPNQKKQHDVNVAISNSFGFGGHNAVVVFAPFTP
ncbi:3-oxoacyl-[acyl-carrier-protein] synthase I, chloroplastic-like [Cornus florida]|uniref:3-oxoacyl-[acyl-carrier-protein] synthase I, chloroplastic-like n=1 Tax=Cornus florida TaxID=4283 RepID=UPI00289A269E|nr:3-oxoacyl-[acyl-carrier-protein] synthase I, chloroplastic-like [Cornus florida]XP_059667251.1 3-oxoacyl-[acyl-carrier-protein] synthase I, chloroplastic-like [Cornus florida]